MTKPQNDTGADQSKEKGPEQAAPKQMTLQEHKKYVCSQLTKIFTGDLMNERLMKMAGGDASRVAKNLTAFLMVITEDDGGTKNNKKYYCQCSLSSLTRCFLESMNMQLPFDSRKLVSMIIYDWEAELDISYKGFINALNRFYKDAFINMKLVFDGDIFETAEGPRTAEYKHIPKDAFAVVTEDFKGIRGGYCFFSYTDLDGGKTSRIVWLSKTQILANKNRAQTNYVWKSDPKPMAEKTMIREAAKLPFAAIDLDFDMEAVDNRHYALDKPTTENRLKLLMEAQEEVVHGEKPKEPEPVDKKPGNNDEEKGNGPISSDTPSDAPPPTSADKAASETSTETPAPPPIFEGSEAIASEPVSLKDLEREMVGMPKQPLRPTVTDAQYDEFPADKP